jgi:hypothetical protein
MPKKTTEQKIERAEMFHRRQIQAAYETAGITGQLDLPFAAATRMTTALLSKYAEVDARDAARIYDELTRTLVMTVSAVKGRVAA